VTLASVVSLALLLALAGDALIGFLSGRAGRAFETGGEGVRWALGLAAGIVLLHAILLLEDLAGLPWSRAGILVPLCAVAVLAVRDDRPLWRVLPLPAPRAGDGLALAALGPFAAASVLGWTIAPDYVYHWGVKAQKYSLAQGIDWAFLAEGWHWFVHPDYPNLVPGLYAATAILRGIYRTTAALTWSPVMAAAILLVARSLLGRLGAVGRLRSGAVIALGAFLGFTGIAFRRSGDADWMIALAVVLGAWLLAGERPERDDTAVGLVAAFAAASKMEGMPLGGFLVGLHLWRRYGSAGLPSLAGWVRLAVPGAVVVLPWAWGVRRHDLFLASNAGALRWEELGPILAQMGRSALQPEWWGFGVLVLALVLALPLGRVARWPGLLLLLQMGFYFSAYLVTPLDAVELARTSFPRLLAHLAPAALALGAGWPASRR
jgi:hypothetical protein